MKTLVDGYGRKIRKLRISLTDNCNLRCHYCMPVDSKFMDEKEFLSADDYAGLVRELCDYGLEEVRLTGGEPLMRKSLKQIVEGLSNLPLKKIGLTSNAVLLDRHLTILKENRVDYLNISLDSLNEDSFHEITRGRHLSRVLKNIELAKAMGFQIKINTVAMRGVNDHEILDFIEYAKELNIEVRFLELMRIGYALETQNDQFISAEQMLLKIKSVYKIKPKPMALDSTSFNFTTEHGASFGFIASESQAFCGQCSRWRLSADGMLRACLLKDDGLSIKNTTPTERASIFNSLLGMKPALRPREVTHQMNTIGG